MVNKKQTYTIEFSACIDEAVVTDMMHLYGIDTADYNCCYPNVIPFEYRPYRDDHYNCIGITTDDKLRIIERHKGWINYTGLDIARVSFKATKKKAAQLDTMFDLIKKTCMQKVNFNYIVNQIEANKRKFKTNDEYQTRFDY